MSNLEIGYDEHEGKRRRLWWNKVFGLFLIGPVVGGAVGFMTLNAAVMSEELYNHTLTGVLILLIPVSTLFAYQQTYKGWLRLMKDDG